MAVGGLYGVPVGPVALVYVRKGAKLAEMAADVALVCIALQQTAGDGRHLGAGDGVVRPEGPVRIAVDPAARVAAKLMYLAAQWLLGTSEKLLVPSVSLSKRLAMAANSARVTEASGRKLPSA